MSVLYFVQNNKWQALFALQLRMMIQECFHFDEEVDYIVIVRKNFLNHTYIENKKELEYLYKKVKRKEISK